MGDFNQSVQGFFIKEKPPILPVGIYGWFMEIYCIFSYGGLVLSYIPFITLVGDDFSSIEATQLRGHQFDHLE